MTSNRKRILKKGKLEALKETAEILAIPGALESINRGIEDYKKGLGIPLSRLKKKYK